MRPVQKPATTVGRRTYHRLIGAATGGIVDAGNGNGGSRNFIREDEWRREMSTMTAHTDRNSARPHICMAKLLPAPGRMWLLNVAALLIGVVGGLTLASDSARAQQCIYFNNSPIVICNGGGDYQWLAQPLERRGFLQRRPY